MTTIFLDLPPFLPLRQQSVLMHGQCRLYPDFCFSSRTQANAFIMQGAPGSRMGTSGHTHRQEDSRWGQQQRKGSGSSSNLWAGVVQQVLDPWVRGSCGESDREDLGKERKKSGGLQATALMGVPGKVTRCLSGDVRRRGYVWARNSLRTWLWMTGTVGRQELQTEKFHVALK